MDRFKRLILPMQGHNKIDLHWLYNQKSIESPPLVFSYSNYKFYFSGTTYRSSEKLLLYIEIPLWLLGSNIRQNNVAIETFLLRTISPKINQLSLKYTNTNKNDKKEAPFKAQYAGEYMVSRSGIRYNPIEKSYIFRLNFNVPLVNALSVNAKATIRALRDILGCIESTLSNIDHDELNIYIKTYINQQIIRKYMRDNGLCSFIANGSVLPRENGTTSPMKQSIPFVSPKELEVVIPLGNGTEIVGMGIKQGVTVITGGGYSGKSTLLDAIEMGVYDHIPGDGREYVLSDLTALKIYAEDGRSVADLNISPFYKYFPNGVEGYSFSTSHASGSVSQAANVIEAVCGECKLMLIDEDKSATNFMIRDKNMRIVVNNDPIIPFTDRVRELYRDQGVSSILVIGGSSEYLSHADLIIVMDNYVPIVYTEEIRKMKIFKSTENEVPAAWVSKRRIIPQKHSAPFLYFQRVEVENNKKIILDKFSADITKLTGLVSDYQINTLMRVMELILMDEEADSDLLLEKIKYYADIVLSKDNELSNVPETLQVFYESIRPIDAFCCINRMRGLHFRD